MPFAPDNASPEERRDRNTKFRDDFVKYFREKRWRAAENSGPQSSSKRRALVVRDSENKSVQCIFGANIIMQSNHVCRLP